MRKALYFTYTLAVTMALITSCAPGPSKKEKEDVLKEKEQDSIYLFSFFREPNGLGGVNLAYSHDLLVWNEIPGPFFKPGVGKMIKKEDLVSERFIRDPFLVRDPKSNGGYHMVWTTGKVGFAIAHSQDLVTWHGEEFVPVLPGRPAENCWAPKLFYNAEDGNWILLWSSTLADDTFPSPVVPGTSRNHRLWYMKTKDFKTYSTAQVFFDPGHSAIDANLFKAKGKYHLFFKDERANNTRDVNPEYQNIRVATSDDFYGPFTQISAPITGHGKGIWENEGPTPLKHKDKYYCFYDHHGVNGYFGLLKSDDLIQWQDISDQLTMPENCRHGNILKVPAKEVDFLIDARSE